jgi:hypothetical protein
MKRFMIASMVEQNGARDAGHWRTHSSYRQLLREDKFRRLVWQLADLFPIFTGELSVTGFPTGGAALGT